MNFVNFMIANNFNKKIKISLTLFFWTLFSLSAGAWEVDFSRRQVEFSKIVNTDRAPASEAVTSDDKTVFAKVFEVAEPTQDIVIMNTEKGFVPDTIKLRKNGNYKIHVVNLNDKNKNVSFIVDAFAEHHNTIFAQEKTFQLSPKVDGIFSFQCPETAVQGKIIVLPEAERKTASE